MARGQKYGRLYSLDLAPEAPTAGETATECAPLWPMPPPPPPPVTNWDSVTPSPMAEVDARPPVAVLTCGERCTSNEIRQCSSSGQVSFLPPRLSRLLARSCTCSSSGGIVSRREIISCPRRRGTSTCTFLRLKLGFHPICAHPCDARHRASIDDWTRGNPSHVSSYPSSTLPPPSPPPPPFFPPQELVRRLRGAG